jgi:arginine deiminase
MMSVSGINRKYFIGVLVVIFAIAGGVAFFRKASPPAVHAGDTVVQDQKKTNTVTVSAPTLDEYKASAVSAVKGLAVGDETSVAAVLKRLLALRVPREGMTLHQDLVMALVAYDQALAAQDALAAASQLSRLKTVIQSNTWLGLSI